GSGHLSQCSVPAAGARRHVLHQRRPEVVWFTERLPERENGLRRGAPYRQVRDRESRTDGAGNVFRRGPAHHRGGIRGDASLCRLSDPERVCSATRAQSQPDHTGGFGHMELDGAKETEGLRSVINKTTSIARLALEKALDCRILRLPSGDWYVAQNRRPALLAVMANNHLRWPPELLYVFNGCGTGTLSLSVD